MANKKISELPLAGAIVGTELAEIVQGGVNKKVPVSELGGGGGIQTIVPGTNITVDDNDPLNPIVSASGGGAVETVTGIAVDNTDPANPIVNAVPITGTEEGSPITGDIEMNTTTVKRIFQVNGDITKEIIFQDNTFILIIVTNTATSNRSYFELNDMSFSVISNDNVNSNASNFIITPNQILFNNSDIDSKGIVSDIFYDKRGDPNAFAQLGDITGGATNLSYTPSPTNGIVVSDTGTDATIPLADATNAGLISPSEKTAITHSNRSILNAITEAFTTALKTAYDSATTWISTNGANVLAHLSNTSNPHNVTKTQVGLSNVPNVDATLRANHTGTQLASTISNFNAQVIATVQDRVQVLINNTTSTASLTGTITETQIGSSYLIPANTFASGDTFTLDVQLNRNAAAVSTCTFRARINTTNTFAGAAQIAAAASGTNNFSCPLIRTACFKTASNFEILDRNNTYNNDTTANSIAQASTVTFDVTVDNYLFFSGQLFNVADSFYISRVSLNKRKLKLTI